MLIERLQQRVVGDVLAPVGLDLDHGGAEAAGDLHQPAAEEAVDADDDRVAGLEQVGEAALHARGAGRLER